MPKPKTPAKRGQPTKYDPAFIPIVQKLVARGFINTEIAETLGIDERTLYNWRREHEDFCKALERSREQIDAQVEASLLMKANGFERKVQKATASGKVVTVTEYFPPSDGAIQFYLRNRRPQEYREQRDVNVKHGVEQGFLSFLQQLDDKARAEREAGQLPPLLEARTLEEAELEALEIALVGPEEPERPGPAPAEGYEEVAEINDDDESPA